MTKIIPIKELKIKETAARELPKDIEEGVQVYWNELTAKNPGMFFWFTQKEKSVKMTNIVCNME